MGLVMARKFWRPNAIARLLCLSAILLPLQALGAPIDNYNRYLKGASCSPNPLSPGDRLQIILPHGHLPELHAINPVGDGIEITYVTVAHDPRGRMSAAEFASKDQFDFSVNALRGFNTFYYSNRPLFDLNGSYRLTVEANVGGDNWELEVICDINYFDPSDHRPAVDFRRLYQSDGD